MTQSSGANKASESGFTIVELSVVLLLLGIVSALIFGFLNTATQTAARGVRNSETERAAELVMRQMDSDIRSAAEILTTYPTAPSTTCTTGGSFTTSPFAGFNNCLRLSIYRPTTLGTDNCPRTEVTYGYSPSTSRLQVDRVEHEIVSGVCVAQTTTRNKVLLARVVNTAADPLFTYYGSAGQNLLASPVTNPATPVRSIRVTVKSRYSDNQSDVLTFSNVIALRNQRN